MAVPDLWQSIQLLGRDFTRELQMVSFQKRPDSGPQSKEFKNNNKFILGVPFSVKKTVGVQKYLS